jgi:hypothetical protein
MKPPLAAVDALLAAGADPDAANEAGATPRAFALAARDQRLKARFAGDEAAVAVAPRLPLIEVAASTPSKLTLAVGGHELTLDGEVVADERGQWERILYLTALDRFDDGSPCDSGLRPLLLSYLTALRSTYE